MLPPEHMMALLGTAMVGAWLTAGAVAAPIAVDASGGPAIARTQGFRMGSARAPDGRTLTVSNVSLLRDGKPWLPVMGEFHYSRYPANEWRDELLKMKAGGIHIVATYVFWIHHEEIEGQFNWSGQRDLKKFVQTCGEAGLPVVLRCGPWCHGEVRNGGLPDWVLQGGYKTRSTDPKFLEKVKRLYVEIAGQVKGQLWKDGGPVVGLQVDNEFHGPADYLLALKTLARDAGLDVPLYTRTGWPELTTPMPFGELLPLFGAYAEGFWDRALTPMPGQYWTAFTFAPVRTDAAVATDQLGARQARDAADTAAYPYLTCELGGGMMSSYHRRILIYPQDTLSVALAKVGSGSNLPGYYMYHGGTNPEGTRTTLQESQATNYPNDMPVKNYDFQAPLGQFGQVRPSYHLLRQLHLFLNDFGPAMTTMRPIFPATRVEGKTDAQHLRWAMRSDGASGYLFVNNYQRLLEMPARPDIQFDIARRGATLRLPRQPITVPANRAFFWPFHLDLGGATLIYATAQPLCRLEDQGTTYTFFIRTPGVPAEFAFADDAAMESPLPATAARDGQTLYLPDATPALKPLIRLRAPDGRKQAVVLLPDEEAAQAWKGAFQGRERLVLTSASVIFDKDMLRLQTEKGEPDCRIFPPVSNAPASGLFETLTFVPVQTPALTATAELVRPAGPIRTILVKPRGNAIAPEDADFEQAAVWRIRLPQETTNGVLRLHYVGDVARVYLDGQWVCDDFYNGAPLEIGLKRFGPDMMRKELLLKVLPLRKDAPIYIAQEARPVFGDAESIVDLRQVELLERHEFQLKAK